MLAYARKSDVGRNYYNGCAVVWEYTFKGENEGHLRLFPFTPFELIA